LNERNLEGLLKQLFGNSNYEAHWLQLSFLFYKQLELAGIQENPFLVQDEFAENYSNENIRSIVFATAFHLV
jgi:hypothetical protein